MRIEDFIALANSSIDGDSAFVRQYLVDWSHGQRRSEDSRRRHRPEMRLAVCHRRLQRLGRRGSPYICRSIPPRVPHAFLETLDVQCPISPSMVLKKSTSGAGIMSASFMMESSENNVFDNCRCFHCIRLRLGFGNDNLASLHRAFNTANLLLAASTSESSITPLRTMLTSHSLSVETSWAPNVIVPSAA